jgi:hypothetical protein
MCVVENYVPFERHPVEDCYHIYSDGTRVSVLFERDEDKVYGRNLRPSISFSMRWVLQISNKFATFVTCSLQYVSDHPERDENT